MVDQKQRLISWEEIRKHRTPATAWIVIHKKVYDISKWDAHPGIIRQQTQLFFCYCVR